MWGFTGILGKLIHLDALPIVWYRVLIAFSALVIILPFFKIPLIISNKKRILQISIVGIVVALHWLTFYQAIKLSTASLGILCLSTTTVHVAWLEPIVMRRKFSLMELLMSLAVVYGIYFVSSDFSGDDYIALGYGLASALLAATFAVFNAKFAEDTSPGNISLYEMLSATIFLTVVLAFQGKINAELFVMTWSDLLWLIFLGVLCTSFAFLATIEVVKKLGAFTVSLSINLEPVYTIVLAVIILQEHKLLNSNFYIGSAVIILVVILNGLIKSSIFKKVVRKL
jgi:drug/metabolite transporter (DMT)-like permease